MAHWDFALAPGMNWCPGNPLRLLQSSLYPHAPPPRNGDVHRLLLGSVPSCLLDFPSNSPISFPCPSEAEQLGCVCYLGSVLALNTLIK